MLTTCQDVANSHVLNPEDHLSTSSSANEKNVPHSSISELVKSIYQIFNTRFDSNEEADEITDEISIVSMLNSIKNKVQKIPSNVHTLTQLQTETEFNNQSSITSLQNKCRLVEEQSKSIQMKLLNNMKRLNMQIESKNAQIAKLELKIWEKDDEIMQMGIINHSQYKKINKLEILLRNFEQIPVDKENEKESIENETKENTRDCFENSLTVISLNPDTKNNVIADCSTAETQTGDEETEEPQPRINPPLIPHKEIKYLESIEKLAEELGEAYSQINELLLKLEVLDVNKEEESNNEKWSEIRESYLRDTETKHFEKGKKGYFCRFEK